MAEVQWGVTQTLEEHYMMVVHLPNYDPDKVSVGFADNQIVASYQDSEESRILQQVPLKKGIDHQYVTENLRMFFRGDFLCIFIPKKGW